MKVLLIDSFPANMINQLRELHIDLHYQPDWQRPDVIANLAETDILVLNSKVEVDRELIDSGPKLKMICRAGVGMDHFDLPLLQQRGIRAVSTPGANAISVGEQAVGMLLSLMHNISRSDRQVRGFQWRREENRGTELFGKTVGIIGFGNTGSAVARNLSGFGCRVLAFDKYKSGFSSSIADEATLERIFQDADILTLHIPLTDETKGWVNAEFLSRFERPIWLLNLSRGKILPLQDLIEAMVDGTVIAAGLDVLENENIGLLSPGERTRMEQLIEMNRTLFCPHIGGWSHESLERINRRIVAEIADLIEKSGDPQS